MEPTLTAPRTKFNVHRRSLLALGIGGCASALLGRPALADEKLDAAAILSNASQRLAETNSLHFTLEIEGTTYIDESESIQLESAEGDLARPDKVATEFKVSLFGVSTVSIRMITIGESSWTTDLITGNWTEAPPEFGYNPSVLYDNQNGLGPVTGKMTGTKVAGTESIDGQDSWHVTGIASGEIMEPITAGTMAGNEIGVELWIDKETFDIHRVKVVEPKTDDKDDPATWTLNLSEFDEKVTIEAPD
jgi:hypothetical protein